MTRNDRNAANAPVPAWLGWKRNIFYAALATLVSAVFIYQLTRPHSLLGGMLGWELERIDNASREGATATPGAITWSGLFAQLERKIQTLPDARPRAGTAQLIYAVDAVQRGRLSANDAVARLAPAEDAATFNLVARLAYGWIRDRSEANSASSPLPNASPSGNSPPQPSTSSASSPSSAPLTRYDSLSRIIDAQPPATTATLYNDPLHDAWRDVLKTAIRRQDVIASCVRNYRHFDIREHYAALPTIHATFTSLARELRTAGHAPQAETIRQWLDRAYMGLIDTERDYATRLLAAELLTDTRAADFYTAAPNHHRPSKLREEFHRHAAANNADLIDLYKMPMASPQSGRLSLRAFAYYAGFAAAIAGIIIALACRILASALHLRPTARIHDDTTGDIENNPGIAQLWIGPIGPVLVVGFMCAASPFIVGQAGSVEGYLIRLAIGMTIAATGLAMFAVRLNPRQSTLPTGITVTIVTIFAALVLALCFEPDRRLWPTLRAMDIGFGAAPCVGSLLLLAVIVATVIVTAPLRVVLSVGVRACFIGACISLGAYQLHRSLDKSYQAAVSLDRYDETAAWIGTGWKTLLPPPVEYTASNESVAASLETHTAQTQRSQ